jgi:chemotaxis protein histidine kinase CheA
VLFRSGQHQTVIKPLGRLLRSLRGIAGSSILGSGDVALIVDAEALGHLAATSGHATPSQLSPVRRHAQTQPQQQPQLHLRGSPRPADNLTQSTETPGIRTTGALSTEGKI